MFKDQTLASALFRWKGELLRVPYIKGLALLLVLMAVYGKVIYFIYLTFIAKVPGPITLEVITQAQTDRLLPMVSLLPITILFALLDAKRLRNLGVNPGIGFIANSLTLLPMTPTGIGQIIPLGVFIYRAALCILPSKNLPPHVAAKNKNGKGVRIYAWRIRTREQRPLDSR